MLGGSDLAALLCFGIAIVTALVLIVRAVTQRRKQRTMSLMTLAAYSLFAALLLTNYTLVRDHVRWLFLSGIYKTRVFAQPIPANGQMRHTEWDDWGFAGESTTVFLAFDPTDSLARASHARPPIDASGLPCPVFRVRRLSSQWYAVFFYTDTYWGYDSCK